MSKKTGGRKQLKLSPTYNRTGPKPKPHVGQTRTSTSPYAIKQDKPRAGRHIFTEPTRNWYGTPNNN